MKKTIQQNFAFLFPYLLFLLTAGIFLLSHSKGEAHLIINQWQSVFFDYFFSAITYIGDGVAATLLVVLLCFVKYRYALLVGISNIFASLITQTLKHTVFADLDRPAKYFEGVAELNLIPWIENHSYNSFPSGHATTAFATFLCLSFITESRSSKFIMFLTALTIAFSRVYLSQHFLNDIYAGSLIGVIMSLLTYQFIIQSENVKKLSWVEKSLIKH